MERPVIRIARKAEPSDFDAKVRRPGLSYLKGLADGEKPNWSGHSYWRKAKEDMINDYLAEQEWEEEQLRQNYSEIEYEEAEIRNLIKGGEAR